MAGIDRDTGRLLSGWSDVEQSLCVIFTTKLGSRVMRRNFGSAIPFILGQNLTPSTMLKFYTAIAIGVELWEPRFRVRRVSLPADLNSALQLRSGQIGLRIDGDYRPNALVGDVSVVIAKSFTFLPLT